jgi:hypothetical protein
MGYRKKNSAEKLWLGPWELGSGHCGKLGWGVCLYDIRGLSFEAVERRDWKGVPGLWGRARSSYHLRRNHSVIFEEQEK